MKMGSDKRGKNIPASGKDKKKITVILALSLCVTIVIGVTAGLIIALGNDGDVDYLKDNLSRYIYISEEDYKNIEVDVQIREPDITDVERAVMRILSQERELVGNGAYKNSGVLGVGDSVFIHYRGYLLENGEKKTFSGGCNFATSDADELVLGSGGFMPGFEHGLVGKTVSPSSGLILTGQPSAKQTIYVSASRVGLDGLLETFENVEMKLGEEADALMGKGFSSALATKNIGERISNVEVTLNGVKRVYHSVTVTGAVAENSSPIVVEAHFPIDYGLDSLNGRTAYFDVFVSRYIDYDVPEFNDSLLTGRPDLSVDELNKYEGATLTEKYKNGIWEQLTAEYEEDKRALVEDAVWDHLMDKAEVKRLPDAEVDAKYRVYYSELEALYAYAGSNYSSIGEFIRAYYGLSASADWREYIKDQARISVAQKLLFYYIVRNENGWMPKGEDFDALHEEMILRHLEQRLKEEACYRGNYTSEEAYNAAVATIRRRMIVDYGETYFIDAVFSEFGMEKLLEGVTVK